MIIKYLIIILIVLGILFDYLSVFYKTLDNNGITGKLLSSASLTQFYSRICYLCSTFIVVFIREQYYISLDFFEILINSIIISLIIFSIALRYEIIFKAVFKIPNLLIEYIHNHKFPINYRVNFNIRFDRVVVIGAIVNFLIFTAIVLPFIIIKYFPNLSMSSVYSAQGVNFISNLLLLTFYDPRVNHLIDKRDSNLRGQIISGKILSYILILLIYFAL